MTDLVSGGWLMEFIACYDYKSNESLWEKFWKIQKGIKKEIEK